MNIEIIDEKAKYTFTLRSNAIEARLDLTYFTDENLTWSALEEQCKHVMKRVIIDIPNRVSEQAKLELYNVLKIANCV